VNARLLVQMLKGVTLIPTPAIQHNGTADFVYLVKPDNTVAVQNVSTLTADEQNTAVKGLDANVAIATSGFDRLENGVHVQVRTPGKGKGQDQQQADNKETRPAQVAAPGRRHAPGQTDAPSEPNANASAQGTSQQGTSQQ
jgi:multidrug efflux system membrane fusion protein